MKRHIPTGALAVLLLAGPAGATSPPSGPLTKCPPDAVVSGAGCMDKYEASVWRVPNPTTANKKLVTRIQQGAATTGEPGALIRGGFFDDGSGAGPLSIAADNQPSNTSQGIGFRCVR